MCLVLGFWNKRILLTWFPSILWSNLELSSRLYAWSCFRSHEASYISMAGFKAAEDW